MEYTGQPLSEAHKYRAWMMMVLPGFTCRAACQGDFHGLSADPSPVSSLPLSQSTMNVLPGPAAIGGWHDKRGLMTEKEKP